MHADDVEVTEQAVRALLADQFPQYAERELRRLPSSGTVNVIFRLGDELAARFPRRAGDPGATRAMLEAEADRVQQFAARSTVPAPTCVGIGDPGHGYPMAWLLQTWVPGATATPSGAADSDQLARDLAELIGALRATPLRNDAVGRGARGGELRSHDAWVETCLTNSHGLSDVGPVRRLWHRLRDTPRSQPDAMTHGDLIPGNLLVADGRLTGVIDTGGFRPADPALDLIAGWHLLDDEARGLLRTSLACGDAEWSRGMAWALEQAIGAAWYYEHTNPAMHEMAMTTLARLLDAEA